MGEQVVVLRTRAYRDYDVIVDLLSREAGRVSAIARGARKSMRRFGGALTLGACLEVELSRRGSSGLYTLKSCDIRTVPKKAAGDLARFYQLAYVLELTSATCVEGPVEEESFDHLVAYLDLLEQVMPTHEQLCVWELRLMSLHGYQLQFWPCVLTDQDADGFSLKAGGAVSMDATASGDCAPVPPKVLRRYAALYAGVDVRLVDMEHEWLRALLGRAWSNILGRPLKSSEFLGPDTFGPAPGPPGVPTPEAESEEKSIC